jgi:hypothetical protein
VICAQAAPTKFQNDFDGERQKVYANRKLFLTSQVNIITKTQERRERKKISNLCVAFCGDLKSLKAQRKRSVRSDNAMTMIIVRCAK